MPKDDLKKRGALVESFLSGCLDEWPLDSMPQGLSAAMYYSLLAGGKRIRPVLCLSTAALFGLEPEKIMPFAAGLECIHTYSLIHDDLPAMDNDDLRRGKPSSHKQFDEATAILAGDALLTDAFVLMTRTASTGIKPELVLRALAAVSLAAGSSGMVGGQFLDMRYTGQATQVSWERVLSSPERADPEKIGLEEVRRMQGMKTGALLRVACSSGAILAGAAPADVENMAAFGAAFGAAFQIADDILDETGDEALLGKPVGSDAASGKLTYPALLGIAESAHLARQEAEKAAALLTAYTGCPGAAEADFLRRLALYVVERVS